MRNKKWRIALGLLWVLAFLYGCAVNESYKTGQEMSKQGRWEEAIRFYQNALNEDPQNTEYKEALLKAKQEAAKDYYEKARKALAALPEETLPALQQIEKQSGQAAALDPANGTIKSFHASIRERIGTLNASLKSLYSQAEADMQREDWLAARAKLQQVNRIFPNYEETGSRLLKIDQEGAKIFYQQGVAASKQEDWKGAAQSFKAAMDINPNYFDVANLYKKAQQNDNPEYFLGESEKAKKVKKWDRAILSLEKAREYRPDDQKIAKDLENLKVRVGQTYFEEANKEADQGRLYTAVKKLDLVKAYLPTMQDEGVFKELANKVCAKLMERAEKYSEKEMLGNAWIWFQKVGELNREYPERFQKEQDVVERINRRIRKSIAVFDFSSPSNDKDAGRNAADKLVAFLYQNASRDLRIIERENLQSILREMQLGQTGLVDVKSAQAIKMRGIDTFIMGNVLKYLATKTDNQSMNMAEVITEDEESNPDFFIWVMQHPNPSEKDIQFMPPKMIKKKKRQLIPYKQGVARVVALFDVSYKLVSTSTGENIFTETLQGKLTKEDKYQDAVPAAGIAHDGLDLPTEQEVLGELTDAKISQMGQNVLKKFQSLEVEYFNDAEDFLKKRKTDEAIEKYVDAIHDVKLKSMTTATIQKSLERVDKLIQNR